MFYFYTPCKRQKTMDFPSFSGSMEMACFTLNLSFNSFYISVSASLYTWDKQDAKLAMHVGNYIAWNMESNLTVRCQVTQHLVVGMTPSTRSSVRQGPENTYQEQSFVIWSQPLLVWHLKYTCPELLMLGENQNTLHSIFESWNLLCLRLLAWTFL